MVEIKAVTDNLVREFLLLLNNDRRALDSGEQKKYDRAEVIALKMGGEESVQQLMSQVVYIPGHWVENKP